MRQTQAQVRYRTYLNVPTVRQTPHAVRGFSYSFNAPVIVPGPSCDGRSGLGLRSQWFQSMTLREALVGILPICGVRFLARVRRLVRQSRLAGDGLPTPRMVWMGLDNFYFFIFFNSLV